ncbi:hypothetical protein ACFQY8_04210 [Alloscardovia venturai]|uniref:Uncharacterized protein n=1 Tax=Alloscardovia venturai TaxID=1769421 RepID=A0ABW2Y3V8_9BIFI
MDEFDEELVFDTYHSIGRKNEYIRFHIAQCVCGDIPKDTCEQLALNSCNVACLALDVVRDRLSINMLNSLVTPRVIGQISNLKDLLKEERHGKQLIPWADASRKHLPFILRTLNGFVVSPTCFDANVGLTLGSSPCWVNVVFRLKGQKWMCHSIDFW